MSQHYYDRNSAPPHRDTYSAPRRFDGPIPAVPDSQYQMVSGVPVDYDRSWDAYYAAPEWRGGDDPRIRREERERLLQEQERPRDPRLPDFRGGDRDGGSSTHHREREERNGGGIVVERLPPSQKFKPQVPINPNPVVPDTGLPTPGLTAQSVTSPTKGGPPANSSSTPQPNSAPQPKAADNKEQLSLDSLAKLRQFKAEVEATRQATREGPSELEPSRLAQMAESFLLSQRQNQNKVSVSDDEKRAREQELKEKLKARSKGDDAAATPTDGPHPEAPADAAKGEVPATVNVPTQSKSGNGNDAAKPADNQRPRAEDLIDSPTTARPAIVKPSTPTAVPSAPEPRPPSGPARPPTGPAFDRYDRGRSPAPHPHPVSRDLASNVAPGPGQRPLTTPTPPGTKRQSSLERGLASTWRPGQDDERSRSRERPPRVTVNARDRSKERERRNWEMEEERRRALELDKDGSRSPMRPRQASRGLPPEGRKLVDRISGPPVSGPPPPRVRPRSPSPIRPLPSHRGPRGPSPPPRLGGPRDLYNAPPGPPPPRHYPDPRSAPPDPYGRPYDARGPPDSRNVYDYRAHDPRDRGLPGLPLDSRDPYRQPPPITYDRAPRDYDLERERTGRYGPGGRDDPYSRPPPPPDYRRDSRDRPSNSRDFRSPRDTRDLRDVRDHHDSRNPRDFVSRVPAPVSDNVVETLEALKAQIAHLEKMVPSSALPEREPPPPPRPYPTGNAYNHPTTYPGRYDARGSPPPSRPRSERGYDPRDRNYGYERERVMRERDMDMGMASNLGPRKRPADAELDDMDDAVRGQRSRPNHGRGGSVRGM